ncbi:MAG: SH3 domain-containing protein [Cucumibacter sp.]
MRDVNGQDDLWATYSGRGILLLCALLMVLLFVLPSPAQTEIAPSGLPLPRFASLRADEINVRVGPGQRYVVAWIYVQPGLPVEIVQEFDNWRKIRDFEGAEGWVHKNLLSGERTALVAPWLGDGTEPLFAQPAEGAPVRAYAGGMVLVSIKECESAWCEVSGTFTPQGASRPASFGGWIAQDKLWGVYPGEAVN